MKIWEAMMEGFKCTKTWLKHYWKEYLIIVAIFEAIYFGGLYIYECATGIKEWPFKKRKTES